MISCRDAACPRRTACACYEALGYPSGATMVRWDAGAGGCPHFEPRPQEERDDDRR